MSVEPKPCIDEHGVPRCSFKCLYYDDGGLCLDIDEETRPDYPCEPWARQAAAKLATYAELDKQLPMLLGALGVGNVLEGVEAAKRLRGAYHDNARCGSCGGPLEVWRDAICGKCCHQPPATGKE